MTKVGCHLQANCFPRSVLGRDPCAGSSSASFAAFYYGITNQGHVQRSLCGSLHPCIHRMHCAFPPTMQINLDE